MERKKIRLSKIDVALFRCSSMGIDFSCLKNSSFKRRNMMFSNAIYDGFKPIYTFDLLSRTCSILYGKCQNFHYHEPLDHVLDVEKKKKFFSKFEIKEEIVVIFSKTVGPGLLPAPTTMNSDFLVLKSADVGPFFFAGNEFCPAPQLRFVASPKNYILLEPEIFYLKILVMVL